MCAKAEKTHTFGGPEGCLRLLVHGPNVGVLNGKNDKAFLSRRNVLVCEKKDVDLVQPRVAPCSAAAMARAQRVPQRQSSHRKGLSHKNAQDRLTTRARGHVWRPRLPPPPPNTHARLRTTFLFALARPNPHPFSCDKYYAQRRRIDWLHCRCVAHARPVGSFQAHQCVRSTIVRRIRIIHRFQARKEGGIVWCV